MITRRGFALAFTAAGALSASGCGFRPLYGGPGFAALAGLDVETGQGRFDYLLADAVRDFAGPGRQSRTLIIETDLQEQPRGLSPTGEATRIVLRAVSRWTLQGGAETGLTGTTATSLGFDTPRDPFAVIAARSAAEERLAALQAEQVLQDVATKLRGVATAE
ncbi:MAG: hypothetical protein ABL308_04880 [Oceanicaulis sp.]